MIRDFRDLVFMLYLAQQPTTIHPNQLRQDVPLVTTGLFVKGAGPSRIHISAGPAPVDTVSIDELGNKVTEDAVLYLDSADMLPKMKRADGTVVILGQ